MINLIRIVRQFRHAIKQSRVRQMDPCFLRFPTGSCGDASELLARYLVEKGFLEVHVVNGERFLREKETYESHSWVEVDGVIVDITADQFGDMAESVVVTTDRIWHSQFSVTWRHPGGYKWTDSYTRGRLDKLYEEIVSHIDV